MLALLVSILPQAVPENPATFITYKEAHARLGLQLRGSTYGQSLKHQGLTSLADWTATENKPAITGLIVSENPPMPGEGYFNLFGKSEYDFDWWAEQIRLSKEYDWSPYLPNLTVPKTPQPLDIAKPPERIKTTTYRILRDTAIARRVKLLHQYSCQLCGNAINLPDGSQYAEAHHIRPLGEPHNGPDVDGNILCLCPNHHVEMDYGIRQLVIADIRTVKGHAIDPAHVDYHNKIVVGVWKR